MISEIIAKNLLPLKSYNSFGRYFKRAEQIGTGQNRELVFEIYLIMLDFIVAVSHMYYVHYSELSPLEQVVHVDLVRFVFPLPNITELVTLMALMCILFYRWFYLQANLKLNSLYYNNLFRGRDYVFVGPTVRLWGRQLVITDLKKYVVLAIANVLQLMFIPICGNICEFFFKN